MKRCSKNKIACKVTKFNWIWKYDVWGSFVVVFFGERVILTTEFTEEGILVQRGAEVEGTELGGER